MFINLSGFYDLNLDKRLTELFKKHADYILRMCCLYLKDYHLAEDALQETFIKAYKNIKKFKFESDEKTWLTRIAINTCKNIIRSRSYRERSLEEINEFLPSNENRFNNSELKLSLTSEIMSLPDNEREVLLLYYYSGLKTAKIASLLKIPLTTVNYKLKHAKDLLRKELKEEDYYEFLG